MARQALLALEDGALFWGVPFGHLSHCAVHAVGEVVFNTAMTGYQEILTDPSYAQQLITLTYPHIGNVGVNLDDREANTIHAKGLIIRQLPIQVSNWRQQGNLEELLAQHQVVGITEIDTRRLTRHLREHGALRGCIYSAPEMTPTDVENALRLARAFPGLKNQDLAQRVTTASPYLWQEKGLWPHQKRQRLNHALHVVAYDFGIKKTILRCLDDLGCKITVVPAKTPAEEVLSLSPQGIFLSNGPGDPAPCDYAIEAIKSFLSHEIPLFGICLGHQLLALACGASTFKMKFGHHGANHPVRVIGDDRVMITSQNHGFAVDESTLPDLLEITHRSLFDNTIQGLKHRTKPAYSFQGHPEAGPGPHDARALFDPFIRAMRFNQLAQKSHQENVLTVE